MSVHNDGVFVLAMQNTSVLHFYMFTLRNDIPALDFDVVKDRLGELLQASANLLEREWPARYSNIDSSKIIFFTRMRVVLNMYDTIMWISADLPKDPRRKMLVLSVSPLVRTLFEELMSLIFIFQDVSRLIPCLIMTNYTEIWIEREHAKKYHGNDSRWDNYISGLDQRLTDIGNSLNLTPDQIAKPRKFIGRWPTPGKMVDELKKQFKTSPDIPFMEYVNSWIYRSLSGDSHLNFEGLIRRGNFYAGKEAKEKFGEDKYKTVFKNSFDSYKMEMIWTTLTLLLSIVSEIDAHFHYGLKDRAKFLWVIFEQHSDLAKEFYERRYQNLLGFSS